ncbi:MAG: ParB/RepB/Spo0J family partition protein, partial [Patescibacteria group bacterium]
MENNLARMGNVFLIEVDKIKPNPHQPRTEFNEEQLRDLAESIRQYGVLQPLVVTRNEKENPSGVVVEYELIAGERRLRASKIAGLSQVPVVIRHESDEKAKLEIAIIENLQREDLNALDRAKAFKRLTEEFKLKHHEIAARIGKSREYVSNTLRLLGLPEEVQQGLAKGEIGEGHCRAILMLDGRLEEQIQLYHEVIGKKMNVRQAERISKGIVKGALDDHDVSPIRQEIKSIEKKLS